MPFFKVCLYRDHCKCLNSTYCKKVKIWPVDSNECRGNSKNSNWTFIHFESWSKMNIFLWRNLIKFSFLCLNNLLMAFGRETQVWYICWSVPISWTVFDSSHRIPEKALTSPSVWGHSWCTMSCEVLLIDNCKGCQAEFSALEDLRDNATYSSFTEEKVVGNEGNVHMQTNTFRSLCL